MQSELKLDGELSDLALALGKLVGKAALLAPACLAQRALKPLRVVPAQQALPAEAIERAHLLIAQLARTRVRAPHGHYLAQAQVALALPVLLLSRTRS